MLVRESANLIESSRPNEGDLVYLDRFNNMVKLKFYKLYIFHASSVEK